MDPYQERNDMNLLTKDEHSRMQREVVADGEFERVYVGKCDRNGVVEFMMDLMYPLIQRQVFTLTVEQSMTEVKCQVFKEAKD